MFGIDHSTASGAGGRDPKALCRFNALYSWRQRFGGSPFLEMPGPRKPGRSRDQTIALCEQIAFQRSACCWRDTENHRQDEEVSSIPPR